MRTAPHLSRLELAALTGLCALALGLQVHTALRWQLGYDETWHVFMAAVEPFRQFRKELTWEAHPPLSHLLMRWLTPLDGSPLWPRLVSIVPAVASVALIDLCGLALGIAPPVAMLGALVFAVSPAPLNIAICVRAYSLSTMLTLVALLAYFRLLGRTDGGSRAVRAAFVAAAVLATWSEWCAGFVVVAALTVLAWQAWQRPELRPALLKPPGMRAPWAEPAALTIGLLGALTYVRSTHGTRVLQHLDAFFAVDQPAALSFALHGLLRTLSLFAPIDPGKLGAWTLLPILAVTAWLGIRSLSARSPHRDIARGSVVLIVLQLFVVTYALSWWRLYPWGGRMRHQFFLFPLLLLLVLFVVDVLYTRMRVRALRALFCLAIAGTVVAFSVRALRGPPIDEFVAEPTLWADELAPALADLRAGTLLYSGHFDSIAVFSNLRRHWRWIHEERLPGKIDVFQLASGSERRLLARDTFSWNLPSPPTGEFLDRLSAVMRRRRASAVCVIALRLPLGSDPAASVVDEAALGTLFRERGLVLEQRIVIGQGEIYRARLLTPPA